MNAQALTVIRVLTLGAFIIAVICAAANTTVFGDGSGVWTDSGLLGLALSIIVPTLPRGG